MTLMTTPREAGDRESGLTDGDVAVELLYVEAGPTGVHGPTWQWTFAVLDRDGGRAFDATGVELTFSELSSQKLTYGEMPSKAMDWAIALVGERALEMTGEQLDAALPGARAVAVVRHDPKGWPRITAMRPLDN